MLVSVLAVLPYCTCLLCDQLYVSSHMLCFFSVLYVSSLAEICMLGQEQYVWYEQYVCPVLLKFKILYPSVCVL
jgi:hypothetical protein